VGSEGAVNTRLIVLVAGIPAVTELQSVPPSVLRYSPENAAPRMIWGIPIGLAIENS